ncbi:hypothetical protein NDU88_012663 [Pleurodeles waltl]|uniref:Uncharacterized protein n=1 Tax=Pleurodeles waltl TaxID=8319 RepID=A0AAV7R1D1_PLEWA|nr:hypothetical protein NDU88_012663 [Pleurodeles waltl]
MGRCVGPGGLARCSEHALQVKNPGAPGEERTPRWAPRPVPKSPAAKACSTWSEGHRTPQDATGRHRTPQDAVSGRGVTELSSCPAWAAGV